MGELKLAQPLPTHVPVLCMLVRLRAPGAHAELALGTWQGNSHTTGKGAAEFGAQHVYHSKVPTSYIPSTDLVGWVAAWWCCHVLRVVRAWGSWTLDEELGGRR
jgi:hypothetical protein